MRALLFVTDDPEPIEHRHWELYVGSQNNHEAAERICAVLYNMQKAHTWQESSLLQAWDACA